MQFLDRTGVGTLWSICKEKFALTGHTHNYAGSGSPGGSANSAIGVVDYNQTGKTIQIGYSGNGITGDQIKYIAGYTDGSGNVNAKIKDVSKDALKSWLGLDLFVRNVDAVTGVTFSTNVNTNDIQLDVEKADGTVVNAVVPEATEFNNGIISKEDKVKLNGIAAGANNYTLPTASDTTLGGIKVSANASGSSWPICVDNNGLAQTKINGLTQGRYTNSVTSLVVVDEDDHSVEYKYNGIDVGFSDGVFTHINFPPISGTFALMSDIPDVSNLCKFNIINSINEIQNGKINLLFYKFGSAAVDLRRLEVCEEGTILFMFGSYSSSSVIIGPTNSWVLNGSTKPGSNGTKFNYNGHLMILTIINQQIFAFTIGN